jgi:hypothetical protein
MAQNAKIALSEQERHLLLNKDWILTKRSLMQKADVLLGMALPGIQALVALHDWLPPELVGANPKIHRGENYLGLPYVILDYPAFFSKSGVMALRSMFWWGHFFSVTLHLSGSYKIQFQDRLWQRAQQIQRKRFHDNSYANRSGAMGINARHHCATNRQLACAVNPLI